jgi:hypothetical protein
MAKCCCRFCNKELTNGCLSPDFCRPCSVQKDENIKVCPVCKARYLAEYEECPNCRAVKSERLRT